MLCTNTLHTSADGACPERRRRDWRSLPAQTLVGASTLQYAYDGDGTQRRYFLKDHLGSVRTTVDQSGNVDGYDDYYPFGLTMPGRSSNSANPNDKYKFTGYEKDDEAGLDVYFANARMYDPIINRFWQIDPKHDHPALIGLSPYNYALNNPMKYNDPDGECPPIICGAIAGAALDYAIQVGTNLAQGKDLGDALTDIDGKSLLVSAGAGAVGAGVVSKGGKLLNLVKGSTKVDDVVNVADDVINITDDAINLGKNSFSKSDLLKTGNVLDAADKGGKLTKAGRALQKHGGRKGSNFPSVSGNPSSINKQGSKILDGILNNSKSTIKQGNRFDGFDVFSPSGRGARFDKEGIFRGFIEGSK